MNARIVRHLPIALLLLGVASCFSDDQEENYTLPTFTGNRVIYIADTDGDDSSVSGDEVLVADTGSLTATVTPISIGYSAGSYVDQPGAIGITGAFVYRVVRDASDDCPSEFKLLDRAGGDLITTFGGYCVHAYGSNLVGDRFVIMATVGDTGTNLFVMDPADPEVIEQINVGNENFPGTVSDMVISADGTSLFWDDATGVAFANLTVALDQVRFTASLIGPTDQPTGLFPLPDGVGVIYARDDVERYQLTLSNGSEFYLTNPPGAGEVLERTADSVRVSSDSATLLYVMTIGGVKQLWSVPIALAFTEARVDSATTQLLQTGYSFEFSPDGESYAWIGDDGVNGQQLFVSTIAAPGTIVALSPTTEEATGDILWTDSSTLAYVSTDADQVTPTGASALRTVDTATPLTTLLMGPDETDGFVVNRVTSCDNGELVFDMSNVDVDGTHTALYVADPSVAQSAARITPEIIATGDEIAAFSCVD